MITVSGLEDNKRYVPIETLSPGQFFIVKYAPNKLFQFIGRDIAYYDDRFPMSCKLYPKYTSTHLRKGLEVIPVDVEINVKGFTKI